MKNEGDLIFEAYTKTLSEELTSDPRSLLFKYYCAVQKASYARGTMDRGGLNQALAEQESIENQIESLYGEELKRCSPYSRLSKKSAAA